MKNKKRWTVKSKLKEGRLGNNERYEVTFDLEEDARDYKEWCDVYANMCTNEVTDDER